MSTYMSIKDSLESDSARKTLYPTPHTLADLLFEGIDWLYIHDVLEPSAGTGALARCVAEKLYTKQRRYPPYDDRSWREAIEDASIDCIEIDPTLRNTLEGAGYRVVHDDFLTFQTFKRYDLIVMNPPFDRGAEHLLKALSIQSRGGRICCILNAETIRNPYNSTRQELAKRLAQYDTSIRFKQGAFEDGERTTDVEVALVSVSIPRADISDDIMENMRKAPSYEEPSIPDAAAEIIRYNAIDEWVSRFNFEVACGVRLIEEWQKMRPHILEDVHDNAYSRPIITIKVKRTDGGDGDACLNDYIRQTRMKYWAAIFKQPIFTRKLTQNLMNELSDSVRNLADYDFSYYNIMTLVIKMNAKISKGVEDTIIDLFDDWTGKFHWSDTTSNRHYFDGWKTNDCFAVGKKVIIPVYQCFESGYGSDKKTYFRRWQAAHLFNEIEKVFDFLDCGRTDASRSIDDVMTLAEATENYRNLDTKYFTATLYKKGTAHLVFKDDELRQKFNLYAAQHKKWLPPSYGKKRYEDMDQEEQHVVDSFQGREAYEHIMAHADYFLDTAQGAGLFLGAGDLS